ncbi:hypothetical protein H1P_2110008 [Hyella patelloides LEGE 07179]|uniref:Uncharacterized protein n=1 Tax=Hyella patelloides LEGE 07179 TaxID=945734 RepID=A0A563VQH8_9CYAN|nr:hypothetical protein [Hyella patelloides]VEP13683.1 hypothetical protein H1P_2110008 [Hyella patelloides LEGE 07179]
MTQNFNRTSSASIEHNRLTQLDRLYLNNQMLMDQLCDRVYERLDKNLKIKKERIGNSCRGR